MRWIRAASAALVLLVLLVLPPWMLVSFIGNPWPAEGISLSAPFTDAAIMGLLATAVWVLWAQLLVCVVVETLAALSADRIQLRAPLTLGIQQLFARRLVTAIVVVTVSTPTAFGGAPSPITGHAPQTIEAGTTIPHLVAATRLDRDRVVSRDRVRAGGRDEGADSDRGTAPAEAPGTHAGQNHPTVTVMRLDTLMGIADRVLGDEVRWEEIAALNEGRVMNDGMVFRSADYIRPGWELVLPADAATLADIKVTGPGFETVVVRDGESLSVIAQDHMGDADGWPSLYEANKDVIGADPDLIYPGQVLVLPGTGGGRGADGQASRRPDEQPGGRHLREQPITPGAEDPRGLQEPPASTLPDAPVHPHEEATEGSSSLTGQIAATSTDEQQADESGFSALRALLATAVCLSVGALGLVAANRRHQFRRRRLGRTIASTPPELAEVEQAIVERGSQAQPDVEFLDRALRHVAASCRATGTRIPQLGAAVLGTEELTLLFTQPAGAELPEGWTATDDARAWMLPRWTLLEEDLETQAAPYPALVTIGQDGGGRTWLLDLEALGLCGIGGEPEQVAELTRFLVAELAVNAWSEGSEVLLAERLGSESIGLNPARLRQVDRRDALARAAALTGEMDEVEQNLDADVLERRRDGLLLDTTHPVVVVVSSRPEGEFVADLRARERSRVVVVHADQESPTVELAGDGTAFLPRWGISVTVFTLPPTEAQAMAAVMTASRNVEDQPVPASDSDDGPLGKYARADGSLRDEYTEPRDIEGHDPSSLLPDADEVYLATAATTTEDLAALAPSVPEVARAEIKSLDPGLDQDLTDWFDESSPRPKVRLLGPVDVTARNGGDPGAITNLAGTISFIAYLACHERGVTGERAAEACGWKTQKTVQNRATNARFLLGTCPDGSDWLPDASTTDGARRGTPTYELVKDTGGVLVDADLFVRLKFRAQKRGDEGGEQDLVTALSLVAGAPFEAATDRRFPWLFRGQRHDDIMVGAIHDVAHLLATRAAADGRTALVRLACEAARKASPHSDVAWLDEAAALEAEAGREAADDLVREQVVDRFDEDLPPRTETVLDHRDWLTG